MNDFDDIAGDDDELGELVNIEGYGDELGASRAVRRRRLAAIFGGPIGMAYAIRQRRKAKRAARRAAAARQRPVASGNTLFTSQGRTEPVGFGVIALAAATTVVTTIRAQKTGQPVRLVMTGFGAGTLGAISVNDLKFGTVSQLAGVNSFGAAAFQPDGQDGMCIRFDPIYVGLDLTISLTNNDASLAYNVQPLLLVVTT